MQRKRQIATLVDEAVAIARSLPHDQERQIAALLGMTNAFLSHADMDRLSEDLMMSPYVQDWLARKASEMADKRVEERLAVVLADGQAGGRADGAVDTKREYALRLLTSRFGDLRAALTTRISTFDDPGRLDALYGAAIRAQSLQERVGVLDR